MAATYDTALKAARMTATRTYFANGTLVLQTSGGVTIATFVLTATPGTVSGALWTITPFVANTVTAAVGGPFTANKAIIKNSGGTASISGLTVGISGTDIILDNISINSGQSVTISSAAITHA